MRKLAIALLLVGMTAVRVAAATEKPADGGEVTHTLRDPERGRPAEESEGQERSLPGVTCFQSHTFKRKGFGLRLVYERRKSIAQLLPVEISALAHVFVAGSAIACAQHGLNRTGRGLQPHP